MKSQQMLKYSLVVFMIMFKTCLASHTQQHTSSTTSADISALEAEKPYSCGDKETRDEVINFWRNIRDFDEYIDNDKLKVGDQITLTIELREHRFTCINIYTNFDPYGQNDGHVAYFEYKVNGNTYMVKRGHSFFGFMNEVEVRDKKLEHKNIAKILNACYVIKVRTKEVDEEENFGPDDEPFIINSQKLTEEEELTEKSKQAEREKLARSRSGSFDQKATEKLFFEYHQIYGYDVYYALIEYLPICFARVKSHKWHKGDIDVIEDLYKDHKSATVILKMCLDIAQAIKYLNDKKMLHFGISLANIRGHVDENKEIVFKLFSHDYIAELMPYNKVPSKFHSNEYPLPETAMKNATYEQSDVDCLGFVLEYCLEKYEKVCKDLDGSNYRLAQYKLDVLKFIVAKIKIADIEERPSIDSVISILEKGLAHFLFIDENCGL